MLTTDGEPIPGYRLKKFLGKGQFGEVWQASGPGQTKNALKFIPLSHSAALKEFRGLKLIKDLSHPRLINIQALWLLDGNGDVMPDEAFDDIASLGMAGNRTISSLDQRPAYLVVSTDLGERNLEDVLEECQAKGEQGIEAKRLLRYIREAAEGVDYLNCQKHELEGEIVSIQHRDIKPQNLLLRGDSTVLCDFGLARASSLASVQATRMIGSPAFMAPECIDGKGINKNTDQYSLAITYYHLRTGEFPFPDNTMPWKYHSEGLLVFDHVPPAEQIVLRQATSVTPSQRFDTCVEFIDALTKAVERPDLPPNSLQGQDTLVAPLDPSETRSEEPRWKSRTRKPHETTRISQAAKPKKSGSYFGATALILLALGALIALNLDKLEVWGGQLASFVAALRNDSGPDRERRDVPNKKETNGPKNQKKKGISAANSHAEDKDRKQRVDTQTRKKQTAPATATDVQSDPDRKDRDRNRTKATRQNETSEEPPQRIERPRKKLPPPPPKVKLQIIPDDSRVTVNGSSLRIKDGEIELEPSGELYELIVTNPPRFEEFRWSGTGQELDDLGAAIELRESLIFLLGLADESFRFERWDHARLLYKRALAQVDEDDLKSRRRALLGLASTYEKLGDAGQALQTYDEILAEAPKSMEARLGRARLLLSQNRIPEAAAEFHHLREDGIRLSARDRQDLANAYRNLAEQAKSRREFQQAITFYEQAGELIPAQQFEAQIAEIEYEWAQAQLTGGDKPEALKLFRQALTRRPRDSNLILRIAQLSAELGDQAGALKAYQEALAIRDAPSARLEMARLLLDSGEPDLAISELQKLRNADYEIDRVNSILADAFIVKGRAKLMAKDYSDAVVELVTALALKQTEETCKLLGVAYFQQKKFDSAISYLNRIENDLQGELDTVSKNVLFQALRERARIRQRQRQFSSALTDARRALKLAPAGDTESLERLIRELEREESR